MSKIIAAAIAAGLVMATSSLSFAAPPKNTPGHLMQQRGPVAGHPGASGYAPGHVKKQHRVRGASAYAPGRRK